MGIFLINKTAISSPEEKLYQLYDKSYRNFHSPKLSSPRYVVWLCRSKLDELPWKRQISLWAAQREESARWIPRSQRCSTMLRRPSHARGTRAPGYVRLGRSHDPALRGVRELRLLPEPSSRRRLQAPFSRQWMNARKKGQRGRRWNPLLRPSFGKANRLSKSPT